MNYTVDWTKKEDKELKEFHECDWNDTCVMCKEYDDCVRAKNVVVKKIGKYEIIEVGNPQVGDYMVVNTENGESQEVPGYGNEGLDNAVFFIENYAEEELN